MNFYSYFSFTLKLLFTIFIVIICSVLYKFILFPLWRVRFYKKQGLKTYFFPFFGLNRRGRISELENKDVMGYYRNLANENPNVPAEVGNFANRVTVILYDPKLIKEFYAKQAFYQKVKPTKAMKTIMGTGLVLAEGDVWKNHRKTISSVFHFEFLKQNVPLIVATTREFLTDLSKASMKNVNIIDEIQKITGEVVGRIFFGENLNKYSIKGQPLTLHLAGLMAKTTGGFSRNYWLLLAVVLGLDMEVVSSFKEMMDEVRSFRQFCGRIIEERRSSKIQNNDLLGLLLQTQNSPKVEDRFSDEDIINEFVTFFIAGMDTTGHLITMALYLLSKNKESMIKLQQEISQVYNQGPVTLDILNKMDFMQGVLKETLRFYTPAPIIFSRIAQVDHEIGNYKIKKGTSVRPTALYNYANPKYFDKPALFKPERWLDKKDNEIDSYVYIPFSAGARNCIGQHLAMIEAKIIISEFLKIFEFKITPEDYELVMVFNFLYGPKQKIFCDLELKK